MLARMLDLAKEGNLELKIGEYKSNEKTFYRKNAVVNVTCNLRRWHR